MQQKWVDYREWIKVTEEKYHTRMYVNWYKAYAEVLLTVMTGGIRNVCIFLLEFSSTSTNSATIDASPPLCKITKQQPQHTGTQWGA